MPGGPTRLKQYDRAYFDRWYRDPRHRVATRADVARKAALVVGIGEALLQRPVRSVLDVGCGEGTWRAALRRLRPRLRYTGIDASAYVVERFGASRDIRLGTFGALADADLTGSYDLIICCDVLQYIAPPDLRSGLREVAARLRGVAYLEAYTTADAIEGDRRAWFERSPAAYRRSFRAAGLTGVGMHCWVGERLRPLTVALERSTD